MKRTALIAAALLSFQVPGIVWGQTAPTPSPAQATWHDLELGMFIHIAPQTWQNSETDKGDTPLSAINPERLDTDQWVRVAKSMGAKYIVFVAKHEGGFCWWQTATTDWSVKHTPWRAGKGDVLAALSKSCAAAGMKLGVYISPQDRHHLVGVGGKADDAAKQADYERLFRQQLTEVLGNYGPMMEVWFDGSLVFDVGDITRKLAPDAVIFQGPQASIRWVGNELGVAPYPAWNTVKSGAKKWGDYTAEDGDPDGDRWLPNECDARIRDSWFWNTRNEASLKSVDALMKMYEQSVGRGAVLLLNVTPDTTGLMPEADVARAAAFGAAIESQWGTPVSDTRGEGEELTIQPSAPLKIDRVMIREDIAQGERIREYVIEALVAGEWKPVAGGKSVGHCRMERFTPVEASSVRFRVLASKGTPQIRSFAIYRARP
jgi:alpha-L-fucosidase